MDDDVLSDHSFDYCPSEEEDGLHNAVAAARNSQPSTRSTAVTFYLPAQDWSRRYSSTFFTVTIPSRKVVHQMPVERFVSGVSVGRKKFPALYYQVEVSFGHDGRRVYLRRYSQFKWLYDELSKNPPQAQEHIEKFGPNIGHDDEGTPGLAPSFVENLHAQDRPPLSMPPSRSCGIILPHTKEEEEQFYDQRQQELQEFCEDVLSLPGAAAHPAVAAFFELEQCRHGEPPHSSSTPNDPLQNLRDDSRGTAAKSSSFPFDVVVVTSPDATAARAALAGSLQDLVRYLDELHRDNDGSLTNDSSGSHGSRGMPPARYSSLCLDDNDETNSGDEEYLLSSGGVIILSTTDPMGARCGSGGGTVAALAHAEEVYQKLAGGDVECGQPSVLIIHAGGDSSRCPTQMALGKAWTSLPICRRSGDGKTRRVEVSSPTQMLLHLLNNFFRNLPSGSVVVAAGDCLISLGRGGGDGVPHLADFEEEDTATGRRGGGVVMGLAVPAPLETAKNHGVFLVQQQPIGEKALEPAELSGASAAITPIAVSKFLQKPSVETLKHEIDSIGTIAVGDKMKNKAWIDTGVVVFYPRAARTLCKLGGFGRAASANARKKGQQQADGDEADAAAESIVDNTSTEEDVAPLLLPCTKAGLEAMYMRSQQKMGQVHHDEVNQIDQQSEVTEFAAFARGHALPVDLYSHIMLALPTSTSRNVETRQHYMEKMKGSLKVVKEKEEAVILSDLYDVLSNMSFRACCVDDGEFCHLGTTRELIEFQCFGVCNAAPPNGPDESVGDDEIAETKKRYRDFGESCQLISRASSFLRRDIAEVDATSVVVNTSFNVSTSTDDQNALTKGDGIYRSFSLANQNGQSSSVGANCVLEHCNITVVPNMSFKVGSGCLLSGVRGSFFSKASSSICINDSMVVQQTRLKRSWRTLLGLVPQICCRSGDDLDMGQEDFVFSVMSANDAIKSCQTIYGISFDAFFACTGLSPDDIWPSTNSLPEEKRNLWNAHIHTVVANSGSQINLDPILGWISCLEADPSCSSTWRVAGNMQILIDNVQEWKNSTRLSLQQIRAVSDAYEEYSFRHQLQQHIECTTATHFADMRSILMKNLHLNCDTTPFEESFLGGDSSPLLDLVNVLEDVIDSSVAREVYDVASRGFMVLAGILLDIATKLLPSTKKTFSPGLIQCLDDDGMALPPDKVRLLKRAVEQLRPQQVHLEDIATKESSDALQRRKDACSEIISLMNSLLERAVKWHPPMPWAIVLDHVEVMKECANFLEQAAAALTEVCVRSSDITLAPALPPVPVGRWVVASAPGRIDLAGGWSDTPPISYENGGAVANLAVRVDERKPIAARCRRTEEKGCVLVTEQRSLKDGKVLYRDETRLETLGDVADFRDPRSSAALLKASMICLGVIPNVSLLDQDNLQQPIQPFIDAFFQSNKTGADTSAGIEIISTSFLPRGCGMGGSSILAGCVLAAVCRCAGLEIIVQADSGTDETCKDHDRNLIYCVLIVEQLMTTGGGWQDQVGGLLPGFKIGRTAARHIPMKLSIANFIIEKDTLRELNDRLVLAYTGAPRLAKNLLRNVLRQWAHRAPKILATVSDLVDGAEATTKALLEDGNVDELGRLISEYWEQKKVMVGGSKDDQNYGGEPPIVRELLNLLRTEGEIVGGSLLGAGGGGILVLLAKHGRKGTDLEAIATNLFDRKSSLQTGDGLEKFTWHKCSVCNEGLTVAVREDAATDDEASFFSICNDTDTDPA